MKNSPRQREGCVPMVRTTFRRPPQSHVTSLGRRGYLGGAGLPSGAGMGQSMQNRGRHSTYTRPPEGHSPRQQGRGTRRQQLWTPQRSHGRSERADGRHARTPQAAHSATRRAGRTAARQLKPRPQAAPQVGLAQAADARPDGQLAQALLPASARKTRHLAWAGDVVRQRKRQRGGAGAPPKKHPRQKKRMPRRVRRGASWGALARVHG